MLFSELAATSAAVGATRSRKRKAELLGAALRQLGPGEIEPGVAFLSGELRQRRTGVGWATLRELPPPATAPELGVAEVDAAFARIAALEGAGSQAARREAVTALFARATAPEQAFLRGLASGEIRQGALAGVMADAVAVATCNAQLAIGGSMLLATRVNVTFDFMGNAPTVVPINGGTGKYVGARGTVTSAGVGNSNNSDLTVRVRT